VDLKDLFAGVEFETYQRREHLAQAMLGAIMSRAEGITGSPPGVSLEPEPEPEPERPAVPEGVPPFASVLEWLSASKLEACHAALDEIGYGDDLDMLIEGDGDEVAEILTAVEQLAVDDKKAKPKVKKFKRELSKLRGRAEQFESNSTDHMWRGSVLAVV
jgi:hypothetical protein